MFPPNTAVQSLIRSQGESESCILLSRMKESFFKYCFLICFMDHSEGQAYFVLPRVSCERHLSGLGS